MFKNPKEVRAFIPGTVIEINVKQNDKVKKGDILAIFDAMKMHNRILSPFDGTVAEVCVTVNAKVPKDTILFVVEPS